MVSAIVIVGLVLLVSVAFFILRKNRSKPKPEKHISVAELSQRMTQRERFVILDLRHPLDVLAAPQVIPGAIPVKPDELDAHLGNIPRNADVVLYCTCPNEETSLMVHHQLIERGFQHVRVLTGGLPAWKRQNLPLEELYPALENQLRSKVGSGLEGN